MRLSEAIRLGAMLKPQGFDDYRTDDGRTCAVGAAQEAMGGAAAFVAWQQLEHTVGGHCPLCGLTKTEDGVRINVVPHLNDCHRWTREQIADWVETVEPRSTEPATAPVEEFAEILSVVIR